MLESSPLTVLTFIAAPAVLTNASSVLALGTSNRFARSVDRARQLMNAVRGSADKTDPLVQLQVRLLSLAERRANLLLRGLSSFYFALGCFAGGSVLSLIGAILSSISAPQSVLTGTLTLALLVGLAGLAGLIVGGALLVRETRVTLHALEEEVGFFRADVARRAEQSSPSPAVPGQGICALASASSNPRIFPDDDRPPVEGVLRARAR